ncbi:hypothetical protein [Novipirellula artificiosorum]|uniref:Uncharacterized protein n=1 Tax=Novipirellula artificiosorum TaxID=2528016 RepID=A0A5C6D637_9BACT|nr:hypothetical protein [Novipirellula artificiosorum]TWU31167.1 hypothetical protein Poly41_63580 [Novipirellula artificiosorum]
MTDHDKLNQTTNRLMAKQYLIAAAAVLLCATTGCVILAKRGEFKGKNDSLFTAKLKQNVTLNGNGATFRMWKGDYHTDAYAKAEWRHCLSILSCNNVKVTDLTLADTPAMPRRCGPSHFLHSNQRRLLFLGAGQCGGIR